MLNSTPECLQPHKALQSNVREQEKHILSKPPGVTPWSSLNPFSSLAREPLSMHTTQLYDRHMRSAMVVGVEVGVGVDVWVGWGG